MENHDGKQPSELGIVGAVVAQAQFTEMLNWMNRRWFKLAPGYRCPECGGPLWGKVEQGGRMERHRCSGCGWNEAYVVK